MMSTCPHIVTSGEGTSYCDLAQSTADRLAEAEALLREYHETWPGPLVHPHSCKVCAFLADHDEGER